jgi:acyl dehydratase
MELKPDLSIVGSTRGPVAVPYTWQEVVRYALGVGAKADDLEYVYERVSGGLKVLPSFVVVAGLHAAWPDIGEVEHSLFLHGEQAITLHRALPPEGTLLHSGEVTDIFDKGTGALYKIVVSGTLEDGSPVYEAEWAIFYVGAGNFGGERGPKAEKVVPPEGVSPDFSKTETIPEDQAALYRLCGDYNPLHIDPAAAAVGGFDRPILHGLCTYGYATRAFVEQALAGEVDRFRSFRARMSSVVFPGDTLTTEGWKDGDRWIIQSRTDNGVVLSNGVAVGD